MPDLTIHEAKKLVASNLLQKSGISGVGIDPPTPTLIVYTNDQNTASRVPAVLAGYPVRVVVTGEVKTQQTGEVRPAPGGVSVGNVAITAGTLGAPVYEVGTGKALFLSNWHVLSFGQKVGSDIVQPGTYDGGSWPLDGLGTLYKYVPLSSGGYNFADAAVGIPLDPSYLADNIEGIGTVTSIGAPKINMPITKSGRTTGVTTGNINDISATIKVSGYPWGDSIFEDCIVTDAMSQSGDSGSVGVDPNNNAVALLFAGSNTITVWNRMPNVAALLGITFDPSGILSLPPGSTTLGTASGALKYAIPLGVGISAIVAAITVIRHR